MLLDGVAAVVNDGIVLRSELDRQERVIAERLQQQGQQLPPRNLLRQQVLERLVLQEIQMQRAERARHHRCSDEMLNEALADVATRNNIQFSDLPATLEAQGVDYADYREEVRREMTLNLLRQRDVYSRIYVSPRELEQCVAAPKAAGRRRRVRPRAHPGRRCPRRATPEQAEERVARAQGIYERARRGEDFAPARDRLLGRRHGARGRRARLAQGTQLPSFAADVIAALQPGEVTEPIRTPSGLHIFKLVRQRGATASAIVSQVHARHILLQTNAVEDDDTVRQKLAQFRERILDGENFEAIAAVNSDDPGSAASGGDLGWTGPGTFVPAFEAVARLARGGRDQRAVQDPVRLAHRAAARPAHLRRHRRRDPQPLRGAAARIEVGRGRPRSGLRRLRDEAFVETRL